MEEKKELFVIGDRILIAPDREKNKTDSGLYLPQGVGSKQATQAGTVIKTGPGYIIPTSDPSSEPWSEQKNEPQFIPLQVAVGDYALFLRREAIEIEFEGKSYLIVGHSSILAVVRSELSEPLG